MADRQTKIVANWIFIGVAMLVVQVLIGGITRLTGSGLSITEWKPLMGTLPPLNNEQWQEAFAKYREIAQYKYLNMHFTLGDFQFIFFWEWFHRVWARLIGVVFLIPFVYFLVKGYFKKWMVTPLLILFVLGGLQGAIGWIMVMSGLNNEDLYVSHIRLAAHFIAAMVLISYTLVFGLKLARPKASLVQSPGMRKAALLITAGIVVQLVFGAFMAGLKAAAAAPTWPSINGAMVPDVIFTNGTIVNDILHNKITIHFIHRTLAYLLAAAIGIWWFKYRHHTGSVFVNRLRNTSMILVLGQISVGIVSVLSSRYIVAGSFGLFEWTALLHQLVGMLLLLNFVAIVYTCKSVVQLPQYVQAEKQSLEPVGTY